MRRRVAGFGGIVFLFFLHTSVVSTVFALDPNKAITQYVHDVWQIEQGLPQNSVQDIVQTRDGYLWLATQEGLVRFDGVRFTVFEKANTREMKHNWVWTLFEDRGGSLWIGTYGGGLTRFKDGKFTSFTTQKGLSNDFVYSIHEDHKGSLWIGTYGGGLNRYKDGKFTSFATKEGLSSDRVWSIYEDRQGS